MATRLTFTIRSPRFGKIAYNIMYRRIYDRNVIGATAPKPDVYAIIYTVYRATYILYNITRVHNIHRSLNIIYSLNVIIIKIVRVKFRRASATKSYITYLLQYFDEKRCKMHIPINVYISSNI